MAREGAARGLDCFEVVEFFLKAIRVAAGQFFIATG